MQSCGPPGIEFETNDLEAFASELYIYKVLGMCIYITNADAICISMLSQ